MSRLKVTLLRSPVGHPKNQGKTARALGLTRIGRTVVRPDNPAFRGMVNTISHLVTVEKTDDENA